MADDRRRTRREFHAHIDAKAHSYVAEERADRLVWKTGGHIIDIILSNYGLRARDHRCEMYLTPGEEREIDRVLQRHGIAKDFVVVEPNSKQDWFGDLRAWPVDRWQEVVNRVHDSGRQIVQVGEGGGHVLRHTIDLTGRIPVRIAIGLMKRSRLFLGLEGGLMHAANSVGVPAVIVWGGLTLPEFAGYREFHQVLCSYVECAPCGLRGNCPYGKKCLTTIEVDEVMRAIHHVLSGVGRPHPALRS